MAVTGYLLRTATGRTITEAGGLAWIAGDLDIASGGGPTRTARLSTNSTTAYGTGSFTTGSFTPSDNSLLVVAVGCQPNGGSSDPSTDLTITDSVGLTWTSRATAGTASWWSLGMRIWTAPVTTGASMTLTIDCGANDVYLYLVSAVDYTGYAGIGTSGSNNATALDGADSVTLGAAPASTSEIFGALVTNPETTGSATPGASHTEVYDIDGTGAAMQTQVRPAGSTSTAFSWADVGASGPLWKGVAAAIEITAAAGGGSTNCTVAWTEDDDTLVAAALETFTSTSAWTEDDDTIAAAAAETITSTVAYTEDDDTLVAAMAEAIVSTIAWTEDDDALVAAAAETFTSTAAWTEDDDTWVIAAENTPASGDCTIAWTEDDDTIVAAMAEEITATTAWTEDDDVLVADALETFLATTAWTEDDDTLVAASAESFAVTVAWTDDDDVLVADALESFAVTVAWTEDDDTLVAAAATGEAPGVGIVTVTAAEAATITLTAASAAALTVSTSATAAIVVTVAPVATFDVDAASAAELVLTVRH